MNQGEEKTCCASRTGIMAWIIHVCSIIVSLAVCALTFGCLGVSLYVHLNTKAEGPAIMSVISDEFIGLKSKSWGTIVRDLSRDQPYFWYIFLASLFTTGLCALLSATCSVVLLAKPRLHYAFYLSTWVYSGKFLLDGALFYAFYVADTTKVKKADDLMWSIRKVASSIDDLRESTSKMVFGFCVISAIFTITQLILHISITVMMSKRDKGERSCCLPWNATGDGDVQCC